MVKEDSVDLMISSQLIKLQLSSLRKSKHLTQKQLSSMCGLSEGCISSIESDDEDNRTSPTLRSILKYASALGADIYIKAKCDDNEVKSNPSVIS